MGELKAVEIKNRGIHLCSIKWYCDTIGSNLKIPSSAYVQFHFLDQPSIILGGQHLLLLLLDLALFCNKLRSDLAENLIRPLLSVYA